MVFVPNQTGAIVGTQYPVPTELDKKIAAMILAESDESDGLSWETYLPDVEALIELGWRPVLVDVTGKQRPVVPLGPTYRDWSPGTTPYLPTTTQPHSKTREG